MDSVTSALGTLVSINTNPNGAISNSLNAFGTSMRTALEWNRQMMQKEQQEMQFLDSLLNKEVSLTETISNLEFGYYKEAQANSRFYSGLAHQEKMANINFGHQLALVDKRFAQQASLVNKRFANQFALTKYRQSQANYRAKLAYNKALQTAQIKAKTKQINKQQSSGLNINDPIENAAL